MPSFFFSQTKEDDGGASLSSLQQKKDRKNQKGWEGRELTFKLPLVLN